MAKYRIGLFECLSWILVFICGCSAGQHRYKNVLTLYPTMSTVTTYICENNKSISSLEEASIFKKTTNAAFMIQQEVLSIINCPPPYKSYADFLTRNGITVSKYSTLILKLPPNRNFKLQADHFQGLFIETLSIRVDNVLSSLGKLEKYLLPNFTEPLTNLTALTVNGRIELPSLPASSIVEDVQLSTGTSRGVFGGCKNLRWLHIHLWETKMPGWLSACPCLETLYFSKMFTYGLANSLEGVNGLKNLTLFKCNMDNLDEKRIKSIPTSHFFRNSSEPFLKVIKIIETVLDPRTGYIFTDKWKRAPNLEIYDMTSSANYDLCFKVTNIEHALLKEIVLDYTRTSSLHCIIQDGLPSLKTLSLKGTHIKILQFQELYLSKYKLTVNLPYTTVVNFTKADLRRLLLYKRTNLQLFLPQHRRGHNIILNDLNLDCDCLHWYLAEAIRKNVLKAHKATCNKKAVASSVDKRDTELIKVSPDILQCDKFSCESCTCRRSWSNKSVTAICDGNNATKIPKVQGLSRLYAPYNHIELYEDDIPDSLVFLDLTGNGISYLDDNIVKKMFSIKRNLLLANNSIFCDCSNRVFIQAIQNNSEFILDFNKLTCALNDTLFLRDIDIEILCVLKLTEEIKVSDSKMMILSGVSVAILAALSIFLNNRYGKTIRIYLYSKGCYICCIREDDIDADKIYDAFVSFCFADEAVVSQNFLPRLESYGFKVCVHYRDWLPGDVIPAQIWHSVASSRRTIVMLSRRFVGSVWGLMEFKTAYERGLKENIIRVIVVILDDVLDTDDLDQSLRDYFMSNTYIRFDDPWFWERLYYAMPQPRNHPPEHSHRSLLSPDKPLRAIANSENQEKSIQVYEVSEVE